MKKVSSLFCRTAVLQNKLDRLNGQLEVLSGGERECNCNYGSTFIPCLIALLIIKRIQRSIKRLTKEYMSAYVTAGWVGWEIPATTVQLRRGFD